MALKRYRENWLWIVPLIALVVLAPSPRTSFSSQTLDAAWDAFGFLLIILGALVRTCARGWKHERKAKEQLVTTGPYASLRHPLYFGTLLCGVGVCMIHGSLLVFAGFLISFILWYAFVIRREERRLFARWPGDHASYRQAVPLLFPSPKGLVALLSAWPADLRKSIVREADALFVWPMAGLLVRIWEVAGSRAQFEERRTEAIILIAALVALGATWLLVKHGPKRRSPAAPSPQGSAVTDRTP
jgi:protein-S-isoprenylcysteine O-methyltransferase Ste14